jgi:D-glycero-alpha-D-manno-heptose-7-phosphate kinase
VPLPPALLRAPPPDRLLADGRGLGDRGDCPPRRPGDTPTPPDLPARSGLGSSSSFSVGLLHALHALQGQLVSKHDLALESIHVEQEILRETVGSQDQVLAAYGGLNQVSFFQNGEIAVRPLTVRRERIADLEAHLMLFYTGIRRTASDIAQGYVSDLPKKEAELALMVAMVQDGVSILNGPGDLAAFGQLLDEGWRMKRSLGPAVSNSFVDALYADARDAGALGGKLTGAGGGGFLLLFVPPRDQARVRARLSRLLHVPFRFEYGGSQIIFYDPEEDYSAAQEARDAGGIDAFRELSEVQRAP